MGDLCLLFKCCLNGLNGRLGEQSLTPTPRPWSMRQPKVASSLDTTSTLSTTTLALYRAIHVYHEPSSRVFAMGMDDEPANSKSKAQLIKRLNSIRTTNTHWNLHWGIGVRRGKSWGRHWQARCFLDLPLTSLPTTLDIYGLSLGVFFLALALVVLFPWSVVDE